MLSRQKALLRLVWEIRRQNKYPTRTYLDKLLFVLQKEYKVDELISFYHFYPHQYGPFSNLFYADLADLQSRGYLQEDLELNREALGIAKEIGEPINGFMEEAVARFGSRNIVDYVYEKYPQYAERSMLKAGARKKLPPAICTIGYEKKDIDLFLDLLIQNGVDVLIDVRANPFSMNSQFIGSRLEKSLGNAKIEYLHVPELGIPGEYRQALDTKEDYQKLFKMYKGKLLPNAQDKINLILKLGKEKRIALMCFEADRCNCHRGVIAEELEEKGVKVAHL